MCVGGVCVGGGLGYDILVIENFHNLFVQMAARKGVLKIVLQPLLV